MGHFFKSLGLSEPSLAGELLADEAETVGEDGVILSSTPEDFGPPALEGGFERSICSSDALTRRDSRLKLGTISFPFEENAQPRLGEAISGTSAPEFIAAVNPEEVLNLSCPECGGSLVLRRRDLGVEGSCVWCHTPIVASEDTRVGQIDIFPVPGHGLSSSAPEATRPGIKLMGPSIKAEAPSAGDQASPMQTPPSTKVRPFPASLEANRHPLGSPPVSAPTAVAPAFGVSIGANSNPVSDHGSSPSPSFKAAEPIELGDRGVDNAFPNVAPHPPFGLEEDLSTPQSKRSTASFPNLTELFAEVEPEGEIGSFIPPFHGFGPGGSSARENKPASRPFVAPLPIPPISGTDPAADEAPALLQPVPSNAGPVPPPAICGSDGEISHRMAEPRQGGSPTAPHFLRVDDSAQKAPDHPTSPEVFPSAATSAPEVGGNTKQTGSSATPKGQSRVRAAKRQLRPRKGFAVLMVVIVGFTSGAALASFILPVDEYVSAARSYMESKFSSGSSIRLRGMPEGSGQLPHESAASDPTRP